METPDGRTEFKDVLWQQGYLLDTGVTRRWSRREREYANNIEKCIAFAHFTPRDDGRSRKFVFRFKSPELCKLAVSEHNKHVYDRFRDREHARWLAALAENQKESASN